MAKEKAKPSLESLVALLEETAQYMELVGENDFKVRAYRKGADAISASGASLEDIASGAVKVAGVGEGLKGAVKEYLERGTTAQRDELAKQVPSSVLELMKVPGLGPKKALQIHKELSVNSLSELEYACKENRLVTLKGFGDAIQKKILRSLEELKQNAGKRRLDEAFARAELLEKEMSKKLAQGARIRRVGAMGRHAEVVEQLEFFFSGNVEAVSAAITSLPWADGLEERRESPFESEFAGFSGKLTDGTSVTLWVCEDEADAHSMKWLYADEAMREEIEKAPERFNGWEPSWIETEWFDSDRKPANDAYRCARDGKVKGIFHCHTDYSDGAATLEQMVRAAEERGYEYIGISDHSQSAFYAQGLKPEKILEQRKLIQALQKKVSIKIFHGVESDILADGALDYDRDILESFDFIVGSVHSRFQMDEPAMTARLVNALKNPHITMWGHPTGRLILGRRGYNLRWPDCLDAAVSSGVAIEINANPHRLDIDWRLGEELERRKVRVCVNPDAHSVEGLDDTRFGEYMAEKAMLPRDRILNMMGVSEMEKYLCERKARANR